MQNIGSMDRIVRGILSLVILIIEYVTDVARFELLFFGLAVFGIITSSFGWCPCYKIMGVSTCVVNLTEEE